MPADNGPSVKHDEPNYWDLIAANTALAEQLLAILGPPLHDAPSPRLTGGYIQMVHFQAKNSMERVTIEMSTTPNGDGIHYAVKRGDGIWLHRGMWRFNTADPESLTAPPRRATVVTTP